MDDAAQRQLQIIPFLMVVLQFMMLVSTCEKAEGMERAERALRHDPTTLVELQNAIFTRARPRTRPRGNKRRGRYENKVDAQGQPLKGMKKYKLDHTASMYWTDYLSLKDAAYYDEHPDEDRTLRETFEAAVRMPLSLFQRLASEMEADPFMQERSDLAVPLRVKLAASLRYLALGVAWVALEEIFRVSRRTLHHWFTYKFLPWMMTNKYPVFVAYPRTAGELRDAVKPFELAGFPGMCALTDGVHVRYSGYNAGSRFKFVGGKKYPTVCWNVSVDYNGQPIYVSHVAPGSANDKVLASNYDEFLRDVVRKDPVYTGFEYKLASRRGVQTTRGVTIGVDGGYQNHREFIAPFEWPVFGTWQWTWGKGLESLRKKVECFFGILKKQFRVLALLVTCTDMIQVDMMFKVCCCLSKMRRVELGFPENIDDWRQVDEDDLRRLYGDTWEDHEPEESDEESEEPPSQQEPPSQDTPRPDGEDEEPEVDLNSMQGLRVALVRHYTLHKMRLREIAGGARGGAGVDGNRIVRELITFL